MNIRLENGTSPMPMLCEDGAGETDAAGPANSAAAATAAALKRRTGEQPGRLAMLPSLGSLHSLSNPSFSSSGSIQILDSACGVPLQAVGEDSEVMGAATASAGIGINEQGHESRERRMADSVADESAHSIAEPSVAVPRPTSTGTAAATLKLQPSSTSTEQRRSDMNLLRTRRRQWLEDQARQIEMEEHGQHRLVGEVQHPSEVAEAAAQTAARYFGSPLSVSASGGGGDGSNAGTATGCSSEMDSAGHFRHRSVSITGISIPSPLSQRFILNMPLPSEGIDDARHQNAAAMNEVRGRAWPQAKDERGLVNESEVAYAIGGGADVCMEANAKEEEDDDDDESTVVMDCGDVDNNDRFPERGIDDSLASKEDRPQDLRPVFKQYPAINLRRRSDNDLPGDDVYPISRESIGIPSTRSSDSLFDSMYQRRSDSGPGVAHDPGEDFVMPCRPRSSEPRFFTHYQGHGLRPKMASEAASTFKPAAPKAPTRTVGRTVSGPAPPPPPVYGQADLERSEKTAKPSQNKPSSQHLAKLKHPLLSDSDGISSRNAEKRDKLQQDCTGSDTQMEAMIGLVTFNGDDGGVEVSLPPHLSADGFDSLREDGSCSVSTAAGGTMPSKRPRPANVSTFDRSNSVVDDARGGDPFGGSADVATTTTSGTAFFTPPHVKTKVKFSVAVHGSKGEENAPPSSRNSEMGGGSPPLAAPVGWPGRPLPLQKHPNTSSFGRSASVGGVYASPEQSQHFRTPGETAPQRKASADGRGAKNFQSTLARGQQQCSNQLLGDFRPRLPSLASPTAMEEDI